MKWFFVLNSGADAWFSDMVKVAVCSAQRWTKLQPNCIYDGDETPLSRWLESRGVKVHRYRVPFYDRLFSPEVAAVNGGSAFNPRNASGIYLKLFIGDFCTPGEHFLFTDCDVMFTAHFDEAALAGPCDTLLAVPETRQMPVVGRSSKIFNSGVFVASESLFSAKRETFLKILEEKSYFFWGKPGFFDQGLLNIVFDGAWQSLDPRLNWRPFWGERDDAMILHYHGAKPVQVERILAGKPDRIDLPDVISLVEQNRAAYEALMVRFRAELAPVNSKPAAPAPVPTSAPPPIAAPSLAERCAFDFNGSRVSAQGAYGVKYLDELKSVFELAAPSEVLEWGAGTTTLLFAHLLQGKAGRIVSIDDNEAYLKAVAAAVSPGIDLQAYCCSRMGLGRSQADPELHYASFPVSLGRQFDFVYIDGRRRAECGMHALLCCTPNARLVVHDYRRARYAALQSFFDVVGETPQFRILAPNPAILASVRRRHDFAKTEFSNLVDGVSVKRVR